MRGAKNLITIISKRIHPLVILNKVKNLLNGVKNLLEISRLAPLGMTIKKS
jgi:hypothetical protein